MAKIELTKENIIEASKDASSLTGIWKSLGGKGSIPGSTAKKMRVLVPDIISHLARKAVKTTRPQKANKNIIKRGMPPAIPQNPFKKQSTGYGLMVNLIARSGSKGIGKDALLAEYCRLSGKPMRLALFDLAVVKTSEKGRTLHRSMKTGVTLIRDVDNYRVKFD